MILRQLVYRGGISLFLHGPLGTRGGEGKKSEGEVIGGGGEVRGSNYEFNGMPTSDRKWELLKSNPTPLLYNVYMYTCIRVCISLYNR